LKWLVFSDAHMGSPFMKCVECLHSYLKVQSQYVDTIVINGDFFDFWNKTYSEIYNNTTNRKLIHYLFIELPKTKKVIYIIGNHEDSIEFKKIQNMFPNVEVCEQWEYKDIIVIHGHQFHYQNKYQRLKGYLISRIKQKIEIIFHIDLRSICEKIESLLNIEESNKIINEIHNRALSYGIKNKKSIVMGHTHTQVDRVIKGTEITIYDCGESYKNFNYFIFDKDKMIEIK